jgi:hypothetical protein
VELIGVGPGGKFRHDVELAQQLSHHFARIFALADLVELREDAREAVLGSRDRALRVVLALALETFVMLLKFLSKEVRPARARA